jgi:hypothetical protein
MLISQVRETGTSVRFPFRCDSPDLLRYMEMEISLGEEDSVWFQTYLKRQVSVDSIPNHNGKESLRDTHLIKICAWCRLVLVQNNWYSLEDAVWMLGIFDESEAPEITHGICYDCGELMKQEMEILKSSSNIFNFSNA